MTTLSRGRHRWTRATCLMEYTAFLAGERKSDAPRCTDPVLATLARAVNDASSEAGRQRLLPLAAELVGSNRGDDVARRAVVRRCLLTARPYAEGNRPFVLAVGLFGVDRAEAGRRRGWEPDFATLDTEWALLDDPSAARAAEFVAPLGVSPREHARRALPKAVEASVRVIAEKADDADEVLYRLLVECVADYRGDERQCRRSIPTSIQAS